jgi:hypothetical protein
MTIDYEALAKESGGQKAGGIDYEALAAEVGGQKLSQEAPVQTPTPSVAPTVRAPATGEPTAAELEAASKPFFRYPSPVGKDLIAKKVQSDAEAERNKPKITYEELYGNPEIFKIINEYSTVAMKAPYKEGTDKKEFVNNYLSNMRGEEWNTFSNIAALNKLRNSPMPDKEKLALGNRLFDEIASAGGKGGQPGAAPYVDIAKSVLTDLTNYIGFGVATGLKKLAAKAITESALGKVAVKSGLPSALLKPAGITTAATGVEATTAVGQNVIDQKKKQGVAIAMQEKPKELSAAQMGIAALVGGFGGFFEGRGALAIPTGKPSAKQFSEILVNARTTTNPNAPTTPFETMVGDKVKDNMDEVVSEFNKQEGRRVLGEVDPASALTDSKIQSDLSARAVRVAMHVIDTDPTFRIKPNQKTSDAISEVFSNLDNIDDTVLEQAIRKEGLSPEQFAQANLMTVSDAARVMQQYSAASKILTRMTQIDPEMGKLVDNLFNKPDEYVSALGRVGQAIRTTERESKAFVVSSVGTTVRNVYGTATALTYTSAASLIEGAMYTVGRTLDGAASGKRFETAKNSLGDTFRDAFSVYGYLAKNGLSTEVTNKLLEHNPALRNNLLSATQESSTNQLSKVAQVFNTLNVAQDGFFRKAIFNAAVEKHMRRAGLDMYQVIADGKTIPASVLQQASDETLKATFSYTPKAQKKGINTFESGAEGVGNLFIKAAEFPGGSLIATFPRFMSNAIAFQYRYSVFGAASGMEDLLKGSLLKASGSNAGDALIRTGQQNLAKGIVGTAALAAAYDYRLNNQDTDWYNKKNDDGSTFDTRALFPIGPTLAVGDFLAKRKLGLEPKTAEMLESMIGMKMPAGTQTQLLDQVFAALSSEKDADKLEIAIGKILGDFTGRFTQPFVFKSAYEFLDLFREQGAIQRDPNIVESTTSTGRIAEAAANRIQNKLPILKESLPEAIPRLRDGPVYKEGEFFNSLIGVRQAPAKSAAESEVAKLGIDPYRLYGPSSGDKKYDRAFVEASNPLVTQTIDRIIADPRYKALSPTEQKLALGNSVSDMVGIARKTTDATFMSEDLLRVKKMQFNKLTGDQRKIINQRYAEDNDGKTLEEADDYMKVDAYKAMLGDLRFAVGGVVAAKLVGKAISKPPVESFLAKAKSLSAPIVDDSTIDNILNKHLVPTQAPTPAVTPALAEQTTKAFPVSTPEPMVKKPQSLVADKEMLEPAALPAPIKESPTPSVADNIIDTPTPSTAKAFADEDYVKGEKAMLEQYTPEQLTAWKIANPEDYENNLHSFTAVEKGLKYPNIPPQPYAVKFDEAAESIADEADVDMVNKSFAKKPSYFDEDESYYGIDEKYLSGDANKLSSKTNVDSRNRTIAAIKTQREDSFFKLRNDLNFSKYDDDVLGVLLGEYRVARGVELNPKDTAMVKDAMKMADKYQMRLEKLREKYKDVPPKKLYHGQSDTDAIDNLKSRGFDAPNKRSEFHKEMYIGAPSFTKDLNFNLSSIAYGGKDPANYVSTEIPYADYVFNTINMKPSNYDKKDMNTFLRSITGAPDVIRPVSLPRAGFNETEDMILEPEKLLVKGKGRRKLSSAETDVDNAIYTGGKFVDNSAVKKEEELVSAKMKTARDSDDPKERMRLAYASYSGIKNLMNGYMDMAKITSTKTGIGQQYQSVIDTFADLSGIKRQMNEIANILSDGGAKQKAQNLRELNDRLDKFSQSEPMYSSAVSQNKRTKPLNEVMKMVPKLAKGGLATRR